MTDKKEEIDGHGGAQKDQSDQDVGYGKPPKNSQFKKGRSGNPKGRPKGARNFKTEIDAILNSKVTVIHDGKPKSVRSLKAMLMRLKEKALKGDPRALDRFLSYAQDASNGEDARSRERHFSKIEKDILDRFEHAGEIDKPNGANNE